jgi:hypothetical protein
MENCHWGKQKIFERLRGQLQWLKLEKLEDIVGELDRKSITVGQFIADPLVYKKLKEFALTHRKQPTMAESILWDKLRSKKEGYKFRRQHIVGQFIADFVCLKKGISY